METDNRTSPVEPAKEPAAGVNGATSPVDSSPNVENANAVPLQDPEVAASTVTDSQPIPMLNVYSQGKLIGSSSDFVCSN